MADDEIDPLRGFVWYCGGEKLVSDWAVEAEMRFQEAMARRRRQDQVGDKIAADVYPEGDIWHLLGLEKPDGD